MQQLLGIFLVLILLLVIVVAPRYRTQTGAGVCSKRCRNRCSKTFFEPLKGKEGRLGLNGLASALKQRCESRWRKFNCSRRAAHGSGGICKLWPDGQLRHKGEFLYNPRGLHGEKKDTEMRREDRMYAILKCIPGCSNSTFNNSFASGDVRAYGGNVSKLHILNKLSKDEFRSYMKGSTPLDTKIRSLCTKANALDIVPQCNSLRLLP